QITTRQRAEIIPVLLGERFVGIEREQPGRLAGRVSVRHAVLTDQRIDVRLDWVARKQPDQEEGEAGNEKDRQRRLEDPADDVVAVRLADEPRQPQRTNRWRWRGY